MTTKQPVSQLGGIARIFAKSVKDAEMTVCAEMTVGAGKNIKSRSPSFLKYNQSTNTSTSLEDSEKYCKKKTNTPFMTDTRHKMNILHTKHIRSYRSLENSRKQMLKADKEKYGSSESETDLFVSKQGNDVTNNKPHEIHLQCTSKSKDDEAGKCISSRESYAVKPMKSVDSVKQAFFGSEDWTSELLDQSVIESACSCKQLRTTCSVSDYDYECTNTNDNSKLFPPKSGNDNLLTSDSGYVLGMAAKIHADAYEHKTCYSHSKRKASCGWFKHTSTLPNQKIDSGGEENFDQIQDSLEKQMTKQLDMNPFVPMENTSQKTRTMNDELNSLKSDCNSLRQTEPKLNTSEKNRIYDYQHIDDAANNTIPNQQSLNCHAEHSNSHESKPSRRCKPRIVTRSESMPTTAFKQNKFEEEEKQFTHTKRSSSDKYDDQNFNSCQAKRIVEMKRDTVNAACSVKNVRSNLQEEMALLSLSSEDWSDDLINTNFPDTVPSHDSDLLVLGDDENESQMGSAGNLSYSIETLSSVDQDFMQAVYSQEDDSEKVTNFPSSTREADDVGSFNRSKYDSHVPVDVGSFNRSKYDSHVPVDVGSFNRSKYDSHVPVDEGLEAMKNIAQLQLSQVYSDVRVSHYQMELDSSNSDSEVFYNDPKIVKSTHIAAEDTAIMSGNQRSKTNRTQSSLSMNGNKLREPPDSTKKPISLKETIFNQRSVSDATGRYSSMQSFKENSLDSPVIQSQICEQRSDNYGIQPQKSSAESVNSTMFPRKHLSTAVYPDGPPTKTKYLCPKTPIRHYPGSYVKKSSPVNEYGCPMWSGSWEYKQYQQHLLSNMVLCLPLNDLHSGESQEKLTHYVKNVLQIVGEIQNSSVAKDNQVLLRTVFNGESYDLNVGFLPFSDSRVSSNFQNQHTMSASQDQMLEVCKKHDRHEPQRKMGRVEQPNQEEDSDFTSRGSGLQKIVTGYSDDVDAFMYGGCGGNNQEVYSVQSSRQYSKREYGNGEEPSMKTLPCVETSQTNSDSLMKRIWSKILPAKHQCSLQSISGVKRSHIDNVDYADKSVGPSDGNERWTGNYQASSPPDWKKEMEQNRCPDCASCLCCKHKHIVIPKKNPPKLADSELRSYHHDAKNVTTPLDFNCSAKQNASSLFDYRNPNCYGLTYPFWMTRTPPPYTDSMVMYPGMPQWIYPYSYPYPAPPEHLIAGSESVSNPAYSSSCSPPKQSSVPNSKSVGEKSPTEIESPLSSPRTSPDTSITRSEEYPRKKRFQRTFQESKISHRNSYNSENNESPVSKSAGYSPLADRSLSSSNLLSFDWKEKFKRKYGGYTVPYIDSHCHLDLLFEREGFCGTFSKYRLLHKATFPDNFVGCVSIFCNPASFIPDGGLWKDIAMDYKSDVYLAMGCHPKNALNFDSVAYNNLKACLQHPRVVACGEIGLDYSGTFYQHKEQQMEVFSQQLKLALEVNKPIVIHCRDAEEDCLHIMEKIVPRNYTIHCHCFTGNYFSCQKWLNKFPNLFVGLTPLITYMTARPAQEVARLIPLERLLLETDAPYFVPTLVPRSQRSVSHPGMAIAVAVQVAYLKDTSVSMVLSHCFRNTKAMYGISNNTF